MRVFINEEVTVTTKTGSGNTDVFTGRVFDIDEFGVAVDNSEMIRFFPWPSFTNGGYIEKVYK